MNGSSDHGPGSDGTRAIWFRPSRGDHISVRRERIAAELRDRGWKIDIEDASGFDALSAIWTAIRGDYDVLAGNVRMGLYIGYPLSRVLRIPLLGDVSDPISDIDTLPQPLFRFFEWYEWYVLKRADAAVFVYESSYQSALSKGIDHAVKLPNAVNYEQFAEPDPDAVREAGEILENEGVDLDRHVAIYIGALVPDYGIETILETASSTDDWEFVFVGQGDFESDVRDCAARLDHVHFPGAFEYDLMPGFLAHADVGFCFKDAEQPLKLKEYGAAGLAIIARRGALETWYDDDELYFVDLSAEGIASGLDELRDDELRESYASAGREIAAGGSWAAIAEEYDEIFREIAGR